MNRIYVLTGLSGAGKDTLAKELIEYDEDVVQVQWSGIAKRTYENWYGIPKGSLDDREFRLQNIPGFDKSYLQVLIDAYTKWDEIDPRLTVRPTLRYIHALLDQGHDIVITDTRKKEEADDLFNLVMYERPEVCLFHVSLEGREGEKKLESDDNLEYNQDKLGLCADGDFTFFNDEGIDKVELFAVHLLTSER